MAGPPSARDLAERVGDIVAGATQGAADFVTPGDGEAEKQQQAKKRALALEKSMLPPHLLERLSPVVNEMGFQLDPQPRRIRNDKKEEVHHNRIRVQEGYIALLYYGEKLLGDAAYYLQILGRLFPFPGVGAKGWVIFCDVARIAEDYTTMANSFVASTHLKTACLVDSQEQSDWDSEDHQGKKDLVTKWMGLDKFTPTARPESALRLKDLRKNAHEARGERERIESILANQADTAPPTIGAKGRMTYLIHKTNWPDKHKTRRVGALTGASDFDAQQLVIFALGQETNPDDEKYTFIGGLLEVLIGERLDSEDQRFLQDIVAKYNLVRS